MIRVEKGLLQGCIHIYVSVYPKSTSLLGETGETMMRVKVEQ